MEKNPVLSRTNSLQYWTNSCPVFYIRRFVSMAEFRIHDLGSHAWKVIPRGAARSGRRVAHPWSFHWDVLDLRVVTLESKTSLLCPVAVCDCGG